MLYNFFRDHSPAVVDVGRMGRIDEYEIRYEKEFRDQRE